MACTVLPAIESRDISRWRHCACDGEVVAEQVRAREGAEGTWREFWDGLRAIVRMLRAISVVCGARGSRKSEHGLCGFFSFKFTL